MASLESQHEQNLNTTGKLSIHLLEDDLVYAELVGFHLTENVSCTIEKYNTGEEFLANLSKNPNLVILDYALPDITGDEMFKKVKAFNPEIEVIFLTATSNLIKVVELIKLGAYDYILKDENAQRVLLEDVIKINNAITVKSTFNL
jgi:FixJ family two-component response regulator